MSEFKNSDRYLQIIQTVQYLRKGGAITDTWIRDQAEQIREYRQACNDFSEIQEDMEDVEFRKAATNVEDILNVLCVDLFYSRPFQLEKYYEMMVSMEIMCRAFITERELMECMEKMGI